MLKRGLLLAGLLALGACSQTPDRPAASADLAAQRLGTAAADGVSDVAVDPKLGAVYAFGTTAGLLDGANRGASDVFLRRYRRDGTVVWKRQFGTPADDTARAVTADLGGFIYVGYNDTLEKRRSDGTLVWARTVPWRGAGEAKVTDLSTDSSGNVFVGGEGGSPSGGDLAVYLSKYTGAGSLQWTRDSRGGGLGYAAVGVGTDARGNVYQVTSDGDDDYITSRLFKYSPSGRLLFTKPVDDPADDGDRDVDIAGLVVRGDALYVVGRLVTDWSGDGNVPYRRRDAFVARFSLGGVEGWRRVFGTSGDDAAADVSLDAGGGVYVAGITDGRFGSVQPGRRDLFFRNYTSSGVARWTKQIGSAGDDYAGAVAAYSAGELYLGGEVGGALADTVHRGGQDGFLRRTDGQGNRVWTDQ